MTAALVLFFFVLSVSSAFADESDDPRSFMHGISAVPDGKGGDWVFFSSSGLPPQGEDEDGNWTHDIYIGNWRPGQEALAPRPFIAKPEAQEPVAAARSDDGHILVTFEDGYDTWGEVEQRLTLYDGDLNPIIPYYKTVADGGHSGHVAAVGNRFIVFYSDGWIKGGGVDNLGSGNGVYATIYDSNGKILHEVPVAAHKREWWPLISASPTHALLLWQAYIKGETTAQLKIAILDPVTGIFTEARTLRQDVRYYTYNTAYLPAIDRFVIAGTSQAGRGFAYLIDETGAVTARLDCMPPTVREGGIAVIGNDIYTPSGDRSLLHLHATASSLSAAGILPSRLVWGKVGSIALTDGPNRLRWFSLTPSGLQESDVDLAAGEQPAPQDICR